jgi:hypothetical protein
VLPRARDGIGDDPQIYPKHIGQGWGYKRGGERKDRLNALHNDPKGFEEKGVEGKTSIRRVGKRDLATRGGPF